MKKIQIILFHLKNNVSMQKKTNHSEYQYLDLMRDLLENGDRQEDAATGHVTHSLFGKQIRFDLQKGFPLLTTKRVYWKGIVHELYWFFSGQSNVKYLIDNNVHIWDDYPYNIYKEKGIFGKKGVMSKEEFVQNIASDSSFAKEHGELSRIYGEMWRRWPASDGRKIDQLAWVVDELRKDPNAHNTLITSWNPEYLYAMAPKGKGARFPICHNLYQINIKKEKVCLQLYQRSADIFLGVPFNIASYALLTHVLAKILDREVGDFVHTFGDVHVYEQHRDAVKEQLSREPREFPTVTIADSVKEIDDFTPEKVELKNYNPQETIKAELAVVGGYNKKLHG
jgi:thymidylate synthase